MGATIDKSTQEQADELRRLANQLEAGEKPSFVLISIGVDEGGDEAVGVYQCISSTNDAVYIAGAAKGFQIRIMKLLTS